VGVIGALAVCGNLLGVQSADTPGGGAYEQLRIVVPEAQCSRVVPDGRFAVGEWAGAYEHRISDSIHVFLLADSADLCIGFRFLGDVEADFVAEVYLATDDRQFLNLHSSGALGEGINSFSGDLERAAFSVGNSTGWESNVTATGVRAQGKEFKISRQKLPGSVLRLAGGLIVANREIRERALFPDRFDFGGATGWVEVLLPLSSTAQTTFPTARIDSVFADIDRPGSPGCALGVIRGRELVYSRGYGYANLDYGIPIDAETVMNVGSVSKQFVAAAILKASLQGHLSLDDDIRRWIPEFPDYGASITVRHLVHHTSGIRDEAQLRAVGNLPEDMTREEIIGLLARQRALNFVPGEDWLYSNGGYLLLGEILERAVGQSIEEYLSREFFRPLGSASAYYGRYGGVVPHASTSYTPAKEGFQRVSHVGGVVGVRINSRDMARWMTALAADELGPPGFRELQLQRGVLNNGDTIHYAFGLDRMEHRGIPFISHGGAGTGFRTGMAIYPDADLSLFALCNLANLDAVARIRRVAEILLEDRMGPAETAPSAPYGMMHPPPPGEARIPSTDELGELSGRYYAPELDVTFLVLVEGEDLRVGPEGWMRPMAPTSEPDLFTDGRGWAQIRFERDEQGAVTGFLMDIGRVNGLILERLPEEELRTGRRN